MRKERKTQILKFRSNSGYGWGKWAVGLVIGLVIVGLGIQDYRQSMVVGSKSRFSLVVTGESGQVTFLSYDPTERRVFQLTFPDGLSIRSRSVGEYELSSLYKLGSYSGSGGEFVRRKVQGFMRIPVMGYVVVKGKNSGIFGGVLLGNNASNLSKLDALTLLYRGASYTWKTATEDELTRAGVISEADGALVYHPDRLQQYVGDRLFDWGVGVTNVTIAVVNNSGIDGMGSDVADFLSNVGFDVVAVRSGSVEQEQSQLVRVSGDKLDPIVNLLTELMGNTLVTEGETESYRADLVLLVGKDAKELF